MAVIGMRCMVSLIAKGYEQGVPGGRRVLSAMLGEPVDTLAAEVRTVPLLQ